MLMAWAPRQSVKVPWSKFPLTITLLPVESVETSLELAVADDVLLAAAVLDVVLTLEVERVEAELGALLFAIRVVSVERGSADEAVENELLEEGELEEALSVAELVERTEEEEEDDDELERVEELEMTAEDEESLLELLL